MQGLTVQGASPTRLTPYYNPLIDVPDEVGRAIALRSLARKLTGSETAIARVGLGLRPAGRTVSAHVQAAIFFAGLARKVANSPDLGSSTPIVEPRFEGLDSAEVEFDTTTYQFAENVQTSATDEHTRRVLADVERRLIYLTEVEL